MKTGVLVHLGEIVHMLLQLLSHWDFPSSCQELLFTPRGSPWLWFLGCRGDP